MKPLDRKSGWQVCLVEELLLNVKIAAAILHQDGAK
jgi:hypothetical protein